MTPRWGRAARLTKMVGWAGVAGTRPCKMQMPRARVQDALGPSPGLTEDGLHPSLPRGGDSHARGRMQKV